MLAEELDARAMGVEDGEASAVIGVGRVGLLAEGGHFVAGAKLQGLDLLADERAQDIATLRALHVEMDRAVATAYGWVPVERSST